MSQQPNCAICLERFKSGEDICTAQNKDCTHEYHLECIFPWLLKSQDCPCCRRDYLTVGADASEAASSGGHGVSTDNAVPVPSLSLPLASTTTAVPSNLEA
jgi:Ring finger domain